MDHPPYHPKTALTRWLDVRLPVLRLIHRTVLAFPTPRNLNIWYVFGAILAALFVLQLVTGIALALHYLPTPGEAFASVQDRILRQVPYGWLIRNLHAVGVSMLFAAMLIHIFRSLYYGSYKAPRELVWILGVLIYLTMVATAFFGYVLAWGQMSYWSATVITDLFSAFDSVIPGAGTAITEWLRGDFTVSGATLSRFYALHIVFGFVLVALVGLHIWALHVVGGSNPLGIEIKPERDTLPFHPNFLVKDAFYVVLFLIGFGTIVFYAPDLFTSPDNFQPADPLLTPAAIKPEWYLLPYYAMLRAVPGKLFGVLVLLVAFATPLFAPWLDTSKTRSCVFRPRMRRWFWVFVADCLFLGVAGGEDSDAVLSVLGAPLPLVWLTRLGTAYYFAFFWVVMPWLGRVERPDPLPQSITPPAKDTP